MSKLEELIDELADGAYNAGYNYRTDGPKTRNDARLWINEQKDKILEEVKNEADSNEKGRRERR